MGIPYKTTIELDKLVLERVNDHFFAKKSMATPKEAVSVGDEVFISSDNASQQKILLLEGWSFLEPWGVWSCEREATIVLSAKSLPACFQVVLTYSGFVAEQHVKQTYEISNKESKTLAVCDFSVNDSSREISIFIEKKQDVDDADNLLLTIKMINPTTPKDLGFPEGDRLLGMGLRKVSIHEKNSSMD